MAGVLVFGDVQNGDLQAASFEAVSAGLMMGNLLGAEVIGALVGAELTNAAEAFSGSGISRLLVVDDAQLASYTSEAFVCSAATIIQELKPQLVILPHTANTHESASRLAARIGAGLVTNCSAVDLVEGEVVASRAICGGAVQAVYGFKHDLKIITLAVGVYEPANAGAPVSVEKAAIGPINNPVEVLETIADDNGDGPSLRTAKVVVSGGIGIGSAENWSIIEKAAKDLGAAVGATRAAVEMGWAQTSKQVGFSGLKVGADLYIAAGISGAIHHLAGIARVKNVVAINSDAEANIFSVARFGVVGDAKVVLPAFVARVNELRNK
ncbi:electron transfer flavoprotein subunit alpha/FixB family protein [Pseudomonas sp. NY15181]|uniref:electron transfer flavoprotein subunit alpha/FixB family protein n=1 Tax=Pseudomonas sp. NY15181 TaxID=3400349 RepID=UPI003A86AF7B